MIPIEFPLEIAWNKDSSVINRRTSPFQLPCHIVTTTKCPRERILSSDSVSVDYRVGLLTRPEVISDCHDYPNRSLHCWASVIYVAIPGGTCQLGIIKWDKLHMLRIESCSASKVYWQIKCLVLNSLGMSHEPFIKPNLWLSVFRWFNLCPLRVTMKVLRILENVNLISIL